MPFLVHWDQAVFIPGWTTALNIHRLFLLLNSNTYDGNRAVIFAVDFEKAFGILERAYLYEVLRGFGLGENFVACTQVLYIMPRAKICTGKSILESYTVERGTRQGCLLSRSSSLLLSCRWLGCLSRELSTQVYRLQSMTITLHCTQKISCYSWRMQCRPFMERGAC
ncbi:hypothetical protein NDU88_004430 [Pleurodeles waltl]|uniref:Reverse transcriptase domain-containing protein n=1 Tax=Pleurodeles waltl TaxID=8319 RepID=A0AAV7QEE7_PLEWA|nr:hypothetical protein NDU88_004430 [Pleurodeles waltl]